MFDELRTLSIQGGYFEENKDFTLFQENVNVNVVAETGEYGYCPEVYQ